jgi:hypothetical protein
VPGVAGILAPAVAISVLAVAAGAQTSRQAIFRNSRRQASYRQAVRRPTNWLILFAVVAIVINIVTAAAGQMHSDRHHPGWVDALSWVFVVCVAGILASAVQILRARRQQAASRVAIKRL